MKIQRIDHVGVIVDDLPAATAFFLDFGLEMLWGADVEDESIDRVVGLDGVKNAMVMLGTPDGQATIERIKLYAPSAGQGFQQPCANTLGIRHIALSVEDIEAVVAKLKKNGTEIFSEIQNYADSYKLCYVHGRKG